MLQISGYRLPFHATPPLCPLCTISPRSVPLQPCCFYPAEICPKVPVQLPGNSLLSLAPSSFQPYSIAAKPRNTMSSSHHRHFQSPPNENRTRTEVERNSGVAVSSNNGKLKNIF